MSSEEEMCESPRHTKNPVPARHVIHVIGDPVGYEVCDHCLLRYVTHTYLRAQYLQHLSFEVRPL